MIDLMDIALTGGLLDEKTKKSIIAKINTGRN